MRFYLAGPYSQRLALQEIAQTCFPRWRCTARWLAGGHDGMSSRIAATEDIEDVQAADVLVIDARRQSTRGGMWVEVGIALNAGIPVFVISSAPADLNVFCHLLGVEIVESPEEAYTLAEAQARA